jgi:hypothetical protein
MDREFARFDPTALGAHLELEGSDLIVTHNADADSINRMVLCTQGKTDGVHRVEVMIYGAAEAATTHFVPDKVSVGVATDDEILTHYVGESAESVGWRVATGHVYVNNSTLYTYLGSSMPGALAGGTWISIVLDASNPSFPSVQFFLGGDLVGGGNLPAGKTYFFAVSVGGVTAYDLRVFANFGQRVFEERLDFDFGDLPPTFGWSQAPDTFDPVRVAFGRDFISSADDDPPSEPWFADILPGAQAFFETGTNFWFWGGSPIAQASFGSLELNNRNGRYDNVCLDDVRDQPVLLRALDNGDTLADAEVIGSGIVDDVKPNGDRSASVQMRGTLARFERELRRRFFAPNATEAVANKPRPVTIGAGRSIEPDLYNEAERLFAISDKPLTNIASVRDKGDLLDPTAGDYTATGDLAGVQLETLPDGRLTCDVSSEGTVAIVPGATDVLVGAGEFSSWTAGTPAGPDNVLGDNDTPDGWDFVGAIVNSAHTDGGEIHDNGSGGAFIISFTIGDPFYLRSTDAVLVAGRAYRWTMNVQSLVRGLDPVNGPEGYMTLSLDDGTVALARVTTSGVYTGHVFIPDTDPDRKVSIGLGASPGGSASCGPSSMNIDDVRFEEITDFVPAPLEGATLETFAREILVLRAGESEDAFSAADCEAIDTATGAKIGWHRGAESVQIIEALAAPLNSLNSSMYEDTSGKIRFGQFRNPDEAADEEIVLEIEESMLFSPAAPLRDLAPALTTRVAVRKNWSRFSSPSEFVTDLDPITGISASLRKAFMAEAQIVRASAVDLAACYAHARDADPLISLLDDPDKALELLENVLRGYRVPRGFWTLRISEDYASVIAQCSIVRLHQRRFGASSGKKLFVRKVRREPTVRRLTVTAWG